MKPEPFGLPMLKWSSIDKTKGKISELFQIHFFLPGGNFGYYFRGDILISTSVNFFAKKKIFLIPKSEGWMGLMGKGRLLRENKSTNLAICLKIGIKMQVSQREPESNSSAPQCCLFPGKPRPPTVMTYSQARGNYLI